jgi:RND family efflux transporter MFP subunit
MNPQKRKSLKIGIAAIAVVLVGFWFFRGKAVVVDQIVPERMEKMIVYAEGEGVLQPSQEAYVAAIKGGRLETLRTPVGASVSKGDILGALDTNTLSARLRASLRSYRASQSDLSRVQSLLRQGISTPQDLDDILTRSEVLRSELEQAKSALEQSVLRSPISGVVTYVGFAKNDFIPDGSRVFAVKNSLEQQFRFKIAYAEAKALKFADGVAQGAFVVEIGPDEAKKSFNFPIERVVKESDYDGMYEELQIRGPESAFVGVAKGEKQRVRIPLRTLENVWIIPRDALVSTDSGINAASSTAVNSEPTLAVLVFDEINSSIKKVKVQVMQSWPERLAIAPLSEGKVLVLPGFLDQEKIISNKKRVSLKKLRTSL